MNYTEIVERQEEMQTVGMAMQTESQELTDAKIEFAQSHSSMSLSETLEVGIEVSLELNYEQPNQDIIIIADAACTTIKLTVDQFNKINMFLQKHNDVIFSYMSEITKEDDDVAEA